MRVFFVVDVQGRSDVLGNDAGTEASRGVAVDLALEDQLHLIGATHIEVFADHLFEEQTAAHGLVEHLGQ